MSLGVSKSSDGATLTLSNVATSDAGTYTCTATTTVNGFGSDSIIVTVVGKEIVLTQSFSIPALFPL